MSRIDPKADAQLPADSPLRGRIAIANARVAYQRYLTKFAGPKWERLQSPGARTQRPLWASTGTKDPAYSDVLYVSELIGPDVINTMPEQTLRAFADRGEVARTLDADPGEAERTLTAAAGVDLDAITATLEREGVQSFCVSYLQLLDCVQGKLGALTPAGSAAARSVDLERGRSPRSSRRRSRADWPRRGQAARRCSRGAFDLLDVTILAPGLKSINLSISASCSSTKRSAASGCRTPPPSSTPLVGRSPIFASRSVRSCR